MFLLPPSDPNWSSDHYITRGKIPASALAVCLEWGLRGGGGSQVVSSFVSIGQFSVDILERRAAEPRRRDLKVGKGVELLQSVLL